MVGPMAVVTRTGSVWARPDSVGRACEATSQHTRSMQPFVHQAVVMLPTGGDDRAPGGAITLALCGSWAHSPPCPLAPHHTAVERAADGAGVVIRTVFACRPGDEVRVRKRIEDALTGRALVGPDGTERTWSVRAVGPGVLRPDERDLAARLARG